MAQVTRLRHVLRGAPLAVDSPRAGLLGDAQRAVGPILPPSHRPGVEVVHHTLKICMEGGMQGSWTLWRYGTWGTWRGDWQVGNEHVPAARLDVPPLQFGGYVKGKLPTGHMRRRCYGNARTLNSCWPAPNGTEAFQTSPSLHSSCSPSSAFQSPKSRPEPTNCIHYE